MLSDNIRNYRKINNMSQDELAEKLGVSRQSISLWETGQTQPTIDNIIALSKIFNVTSDEILKSDDSTLDIVKSPQDKVPAEKKKNKTWLLVTIIGITVIIGAVLFSVLFKNGLFKDNVSGSGTADSSVSEPKSADTSKASSNTGSKVTNNSSKSNASGSGSKAAGSSKASGSKPAAATPASSSKPEKQFDLFTYCKDFAIKKGKLNGDYCMYQQPATQYGGYKDEFFSISYWGDSNMVEFCLHCPLNDTYSVNFYLRMRGGYNKKYEYLTSRYYRDNGESVRSATGYIDPAVFSDNYPLSCDKYEGSAEGQNDFMEESRVGICDLIHCLKKFVEVENMECDFSAFDFANF